MESPRKDRLRTVSPFPHTHTHPPDIFAAKENSKEPFG